MSDNILQQVESNDILPGVSLANQRRRKHNSKRRRKNIYPSSSESDQKAVKVEEVINFLCSSINKNEYHDCVTGEITTLVPFKATECVSMSNQKEHCFNLTSKELDKLDYGHHKALQNQGSGSSVTSENEVAGVNHWLLTNSSVATKCIVTSGEDDSLCMQDAGDGQSITKNEWDKKGTDIDQSNITTNDLPPTSVEDLTHLVENLQFHASKNPIKPNNLREFLNIELLKKTKGEVLSLEELQKIKEEKTKKGSSGLEQTVIPKANVKEYFNLNLIRTSPESSVIRQIESSSMKLASELENTLTVTDDKEKLKSDRHLTEFFNINALKNSGNHLVSSIKSTSKLLVSELEKTLLESASEQAEKVKGECSNSVKSRSVLEKQSEVLTQKQNMDGLQRSKNRNRRRQHSFKSRELCQKEDMKFPKYLTEEELSSVDNFGVLLSGFIRINQKNYKEAYITAPDKGMDILIEGLKDRNRALEGDEVYFVLKPREQHRANGKSDVQRTAVVVSIKSKNHNRGAIGTLKLMQDRNPNFVLFSPRDSRLPRIRIRSSDCPPGFLENPARFADVLFFGKILDWTDIRFADGQVTREVGLAGDIAAETAAILLKHDLDVTPYPQTLNRYFPASPFIIHQDELARRLDLRQECVFTIDPETARDLDDAVSCSTLPNGNLQVGVHISDVSYFLQEETPLDAAASSRATTVYLVQEVHHMLPLDLCRICSLTPGEDKLAFSVLWEVNEKLEIVDQTFVKTVINSCAQLNYDQVQMILDKGPEANEALLDSVCGRHDSKTILHSVTTLHRLAHRLRNERFAKGALKIDQTKIQFHLNEEGFPEKYFAYQNQESHRLIEELMLLANITVAHRIRQSFPDIAFLRAHDPPMPYVLEKLQRNLEKYGIILDISSSGAVQASLNKYSQGDAYAPARKLVLNSLLAKPMTRARYYCVHFCPEDSDKRHFALNVPLYTHFTSPIRRYADVMVHRLLAAASGYAKAPRWDLEHVQRIANNCNKQKYAAKLAGEASIELFLSVFISLRGPVTCEAVVCDIKDKSFDCIVFSTGMHQRVYYEHIKGQLALEEDEDGVTRIRILWPADSDHICATVQVIEIFTTVNVRLRNSGALKVDARLLRCE